MKILSSTKFFLYALDYELVIDIFVHVSGDSLSDIVSQIVLV